MRFQHPDLPGKTVLLGYCMNLHAARDLVGVRDGLERYAAALRERLAPEALFGVGAYLPGRAALSLGTDAARNFQDYLAEMGLEAFSYNAFPFGGFHEDGLKAGVFQPTWMERLRLEYTLAVARAASAGGGRSGGHVSISTHSGGFADSVRGQAQRRQCAENLGRCVAELARIEERTGCRVVLSVEAEPRSLAGDTAELDRWLDWARGPALESAAVLGRLPPDRADEAWQRHLGTCLDACHAAVEFETPAGAWANATAGGRPLGKLQFSSALRLPDPDADPLGRERLLTLAEPVYLHQVSAQSESGIVRALDLPELRQLYRAADPAWRGSLEWRCHFHVPVDLTGPVDTTRAGGLATTRDFADELLDLALDQPERWGSEELHVEIETYTWNILPGLVRGEGELVDGLERECRCAIQRLEQRGWTHP